MSPERLVGPAPLRWWRVTVYEVNRKGQRMGRIDETTVIAAGPDDADRRGRLKMQLIAESRYLEVVAREMDRHVEVGR